MLDNRPVTEYVQSDDLRKIRRGAAGIGIVRKFRNISRR